MARPLRPSVGCGLPPRPGCRRRPPPRPRTSRPRVVPVRASGRRRARCRPPLLRDDRLRPRFVRRVAYPQRRRGCVWDLRGVAQAPAAKVLAAPTQAATTAAVQVFARALIRPAPRTRRRFPQLPEAGAIALTPYLGAVHSLDYLYRNNSLLLSVALANDQTGLTVTGTGVYSMGGTGATQIGCGCTMVQRSVGALVRYVVVSKSHSDLLASNTCSKTTHPASLQWTCLPGSDHTGQPVNVRIVGTRKPNEATTHTRAIGAIAQDPTKPDRLWRRRPGRRLWRRRMRRRRIRCLAHPIGRYCGLREVGELLGRRGWR